MSVDYQHVLSIPVHYDAKDPALLDSVSKADLVIQGDQILKDIHGEPRQVTPVELAAIRRMGTEFVGTNGEKIERLIARIESIGGGAFTASVAEDGEWSTMAVFGREAEDSPMAGGASHGVGDSLAKCLDMMLRETGA